MASSKVNLSHTDITILEHKISKLEVRNQLKLQNPEHQVSILVTKDIFNVSCKMPSNKIGQPFVPYFVPINQTPIHKQRYVHMKH